MKKFLLIGTFLMFTLLIIGGVLTLKQKTSADTAIYTCQSDGTFAPQSSGPAAITGDDISRVETANSWLASMMQPDVSIVTSSTITPDQDYSNSYTGATSGSFVLKDRTYATSNPATIVVDSPTTVPDSYRGVINGHVTETPTSGRWIIQAYKNNSGTITQVPVQALADGTTGDFSIDLSNVDPSYTGSWMLGILDADNSYAEYGVKWPATSIYTNLVVQELVVTDTTYLWATTPATVDGRFSFDNDQVGAKMFRLVDSTTSEVLAQYFDNTGLIRSYEYKPGEEGYGTGIQDLTYVYDQALALFASIGQNDASQAKSLVDGLLMMQTTTGAHAGGFVFAAPQLSPTYTDAYYRTGADAIAVDALLAYIKQYPTDTNIAAYKAAAVQGLDFIQTLYSSSGATAGLYLGGFGQYSGNPQVFDPTYVVTFASTEHNLDIWHAFTDASLILGDSTTNYALLASNLDTAMASSLYNISAQRFNQGISNGLPDIGDPLDTNTWGSIEMYATGRITQAQEALTHLSVFTRTVNGITGYTPFYDTTDYPGAVPNVWYEGSFGAALAEYDAGNYSAYRTLLDQLTPAQQPDGSFKYAEAVDDTYGIGVSESVSSTAWYILATVGRSTIWNTCTYNSLDVVSNAPPATLAPQSTSESPPTIPISSSDLATGSSPETTSIVAASSTAKTQPTKKNSATAKTAAVPKVSSIYLPVVFASISIGIVVLGGGAWALVAHSLRVKRRL